MLVCFYISADHFPTVIFVSLKVKHLVRVLDRQEVFCVLTRSFFLQVGDPITRIGRFDVRLQRGGQFAGKDIVLVTTAHPRCSLDRGQCKQESRT